MVCPYLRIMLIELCAPREFPHFKLHVHPPALLLNIAAFTASGGQKLAYVQKALYLFLILSIDIIPGLVISRIQIRFHSTVMTGFFLTYADTNLNLSPLIYHQQKPWHYCLPANSDHPKFASWSSLTRLLLYVKQFAVLHFLLPYFCSIPTVFTSFFI